MEALVKILIMFLSMGIAGGFWWLVGKSINHEIDYWLVRFEYDAEMEHKG